MRNFFLSSFFLLGSLTLPCLGQETAQPPGLDDIKNPVMTKRLIHYWADFACFTMSDKSEPNVKDQCKKACFPDGVKSDVPADQVVQSSQTCWLSGPESSFLTGKPLTDEEKKQIPRRIKTVTPGYCICDDPIINFAGDFFIKSVVEMGKVVQKLMCPTLIALDLVVEIGSAAIPGVGKAITVGMRTSIKTAKMFQHAYDAQDAAMEWASMFVDVGFGLAREAGCKTPFSFSKTDLAKKFLDFANAPDQLVPGINYDEMPCPKGKKASKRCKERNGESDKDESPSKTRNNNQPSQTSKQSTQSSADTRPTEKPDCATIGKNDLKILSEEVEIDELTQKRIARTPLQARRLQIRDYKPKVAEVCKASKNKGSGATLDSKKYPSAGEEFMKGKPAYGYKVINDCSDYSWGIQKDFKPDEYNTEHVLEWSTVKTFFDTVKAHSDFKDGFEHPDPEIKKKVDFCTYWRVSWDWPSKQKMPDPAAPAPTPGANPLLQRPLEWFAEAYPFIDGTTAGARKAHEDEFILLQTKVNQHAKSNMFSVNPTGQIYKDKDMDELIKRTNNQKLKDKKTPKYPKVHDQPRVALQRMRSVVGAYLYLTEDKVNKIFIDQVDRIDAQLEIMEQALSKTARTSDKGGRGSGPSRTVTFNKWTPLKFKEKWFAYMDDVYENANKKGQNFMKDNIKRLKDEYDDGKKITQAQVDKEKTQDEKDKKAAEKKLREDMPDYISKLEAAWLKAKDWSRPKWNAARV